MSYCTSQLPVKMNTWKLFYSCLFILYIFSGLHNCRQAVFKLHRELFYKRITMCEFSIFAPWTSHSSSPLLSWPVRASCRSSAPSLWEWRRRPCWPSPLIDCCHPCPPWPNTHQAWAHHKPMLSPPNYGYNTPVLTAQRHIHNDLKNFHFQVLSVKAVFINSLTSNTRYCI